MRAALLPTPERPPVAIEEGGHRRVFYASEDRNFQEHHSEYSNLTEQAPLPVFGYRSYLWADTPLN